MKRFTALFVLLAVFAGLFSVPTYAVGKVADTTFKVTATELKGLSVTVTAAVPAGAISGKIVVTTSDKLKYVEGSLSSPFGATLNPSYNSGGVTGQCASFASATEIAEGTVVFSATYTIVNGADITADDIIVPIWNLADEEKSLGRHDEYGDTGNADVRLVADDGKKIADTTFKVIVNETKGESVTVTASIPAGVISGKIVVSTSDKLEYVAGSLSSSVGAALNPGYNDRGVVGQCASFASATEIAEGTVVFSATYKVVGGAEITADDVTVPIWNLANGKKSLGRHDELGNDGNADIYRCVAVPTAKEDTELAEKVVSQYFEEFVPYDLSFINPEGEEISNPGEETVVSLPVPEGWKADETEVYYVSDDGKMERMYAVPSKDGKSVTFTTTHFSIYVLVNTATERTLGDVNDDGIVDNSDAAAILRADAGLTKLTEKQQAVADVTNDGTVDNADAALILRLDAGLIKGF